jgi:hypothetical protein
MRTTLASSTAPNNQLGLPPTAAPTRWWFVAGDEWDLGMTADNCRETAAKAMGKVIRARCVWDGTIFPVLDGCVERGQGSI